MKKKRRKIKRGKQGHQAVLKRGDKEMGRDVAGERQREESIEASGIFTGGVVD